MLKVLALWTILVPTLPPVPMLPSSPMNAHLCNTGFCSTIQALNLNKQGVLSVLCGARRRVRFEDDDEDEDEDGHNEQIAKLEMYSQSARGEALLVHALVDGEEVDVLIFKVSLIQYWRIILLKLLKN